ncbi:MAG TPA: YegP family protein [Opitutaceae bacterium]|nr:YegP family protein [Opitutaceae bacterium]
MAKHPKYQFEVLRSKKNGKFYWHLKAPNNRLIAWSGQGYVEKESCEEGLELVKKYARGAPAYDWSKEGIFRLIDPGEFEESFAKEAPELP